MTVSTASGGTRVLEIAHVLFMDIVAYSRMPMEEQEQTLSRLQEAVRATEEFGRAQSANQLISLPTGDGMALVFFADAEAPARCALELSRAVRKEPVLRLRLGIHSGPVYRVADINANRNVAGGGINIAQRVMDCGDAGHILVSSAVADVLGQLTAWAASLHDLGEAEVKHGVKVHIYNLYTDQVGNSDLPQKLRMPPQPKAIVPSRRVGAKRVWIGPAVAIVVVGVAIGVYLLTPRHVTALSEKDTIVLADFDNKTGDPVFDDTLKKALAIDLEQSPYLRLFPDSRVQQTLSLMGRPPDKRVTREIGREICQRNGVKALLAGSISNLGTQYVITLTVLNAATGDSLGDAQVQAESKERVLAVLGEAAGELRRRIGESVSSIQKFDTPIEDVTTPSLQALKAYAMGDAALDRGNQRGAIPLYQHAIELDANFAMAYSRLGAAYANTGEVDKSVQYHTKAYELSQRVSEAERFYILKRYYADVTGELEKYKEVVTLWMQSYPRASFPHISMANFYRVHGEFERAADDDREALRLEPSMKWGYNQLAEDYRSVSRYSEAKQICERSIAQKLDDLDTHRVLYEIAIAQSDITAAERELQWAAGKPGEYEILSAAANAAASTGRIQQARQLYARALNNARDENATEAAAGIVADGALLEALIESYSRARERAAAALVLSHDRNTEATVALALALSGETREPQQLANALAQNFARNTLVTRVYVPQVRAAIEMMRGNPIKATGLLDPARPFDLGSDYQIMHSDFRTVLVRGKACLRAHDGGSAVKEFHTILDHAGVNPVAPALVLARLGLARGYALSRDTLQARAAYQDFLAAWKDADPNIPILKQAKAEYAKLQ